MIVNIFCNRVKSILLIPVYKFLKKHIDYYKWNYYVVWKAVLKYNWRHFRRDSSLHMADIYADNMILQSDVRLKIRGNACPGDRIVVTLGEVERDTFTGSDGRWCVVLPPFGAGYRTYDLRVRNGRRLLAFRNVMIGEVWLVAGASVMLMRLNEAVTYAEEFENYEKEATGAIRFFIRKEVVKGGKDVWSSLFCRYINKYTILNFSPWQTVEKDKLRNLPAYAYYFSKKLSCTLDVPVGMVCMAISGTPIEAWVERELLAEEVPELLFKGRKSQFGFSRNEIPVHIKKSKDPYQKHYYNPAFCFESQIRPLDKFPVKGVLFGGFPWGNEMEFYLKPLFTLFVRSLRNNWGEQLPVFYLQLFREPGLPILPCLRDLLRQMEQVLERTGMVVYHDTCEKEKDYLLHPVRRKEVGERFARLALHDVYDKDIIRSGPDYQEAKLLGNLIRIKFKWSKGLCTSDGESLRSFEIAGVDSLFIPVDAKIVADEIIIDYSGILMEPRYVRYAWKDYTDGNLVNGEMLPASTFMEKISTVSGDAEWNL